jgi:hypothetical protein
MVHTKQPFPPRQTGAACAVRSTTRATLLDWYGHKAEHKNDQGNASDDPAIAAEGIVLIKHHRLSPAAQPS